MVLVMRMLGLLGVVMLPVLPERLLDPVLLGVVLASVVVLVVAEPVVVLRR